MAFVAAALLALGTARAEDADGPASSPDVKNSIPVAPAATTAPAASPDAAGRRDLPVVRDAITAYRRGDVSGGDLLRAKAGEPDARILLDWAAIRFGGPGASLDRAQAFLRANPDWPGAATLRRRAEEALLAERQPPAVVRTFFARERPQTGAGKVALALAFRADGLAEDAAQLVRDAWRTDLLSREAEAKVLAEFPSALSVADHRARVERFLFKENWEVAKRAAEGAGKGYDMIVKLRMAVAAKSAGAAKLLDAVPKELKAEPSFLFAQVQTLRRADKAAEAAAVLATVTRDPALLVDGDEWWAERRVVARKLLDAGDAKTAYAVVAGHGAVATDKRIEAEFHAGWIALRFLSEPEAAERHFARAALLAQTPISLARVGYWQGRAADAQGRRDEARRFYEAAAGQPTTYYGQLAAAKLGRSQVPLRPETDPLGSERALAARRPAVRAVALLYAAGLKDVAASLVLEMAKASRDPAELDAVAETVLASGDARTLLLLGKGATQRGLPLDLAAFPIVGIPSFTPVGNRVERAMVYAIARQESLFDPAAQSSVGARGLMQLMPATAQATARKAGLDYDGSRLGEAAYNAQIGAAHLGDLMDDWRGSFVLTFASYNAGPGNARKWIAAYGDPRSPAVDAVDWVERIPFSETRNYVQRVMENLQVYRKRMDEQSALLIESDLKRGGVAQ